MRKLNAEQVDLRERFLSDGERECEQGRETVSESYKYCCQIYRVSVKICVSNGFEMDL